MEEKPDKHKSRNTGNKIKQNKGQNIKGRRNWPHPNHKTSRKQNRFCRNKISCCGNISNNPCNNTKKKI